MAEATTQLDQETHAIRADMANTASNSTDKMEAVGHDITDSWHNVTGAVSDTIDHVKATVETTVDSVKQTVESTVHAVQDVVHDTTSAISHAFDLKGHTRQHPWLMLAGAVLIGFAVGSFVRRSSR